MIQTQKIPLLLPVCKSKLLSGSGWEGPLVKLGTEFEEHGIDVHYLLHKSKDHCKSLVENNIHFMKIWGMILSRREQVHGINFNIEKYIKSGKHFGRHADIGKVIYCFKKKLNICVENLFLLL